MGAVSAAIARSARSFGAELRTSTRVESVSTSNGHVTGVVLESGERAHARRSSSPACTPRSPSSTTSRRTDLPDDFVSDIERWNTRSGVVKINLALAELPNFTADPSEGIAEHHTGSVEMSPTMEFIERAFQDAREGRAALLPFSDGVIPTTLDKTMNPDGTHIFSMFTQYVPHEWSEAPHTEELEAYADRLIDLYDQVAPGFAASITHRDIVGPHEMQEEYGLIGGNIFHGELTPEQLFHMRPAPGYADYRTPIAGLYNASSATHGGGGVCGIPGWQAARAAISDQKSRPAATPRWRGGREARDRFGDALARDAGGAQPSRSSAPARDPAASAQRMVGEALRSPGLERSDLVNPSYAEVAGHPCLPDLRRLDERARPGPARRR